ncbi:MAG: hypothetical protein M0R51_11235 [Clostridia bacterium]|jgi:hypothetical protein|nr:hypothetical protein [Clostridia bacterium]
MFTNNSFRKNAIDDLNVSLRKVQEQKKIVQKQIELMNAQILNSNKNMNKINEKLLVVEQKNPMLTEYKKYLNQLDLLQQEYDDAVSGVIDSAMSAVSGAIAYKTKKSDKEINSIENKIKQVKSAMEFLETAKEVVNYKNDYNNIKEELSLAKAAQLLTIRLEKELIPFTNLEMKYQKKLAALNAKNEVTAER